jgi:hypothetical protein
MHLRIRLLHRSVLVVLFLLSIAGVAGQPGMEVIVLRDPIEIAADLAPISGVSHEQSAGNRLLLTTAGGLVFKYDPLTNWSERVSTSAVSGAAAEFIADGIAVLDSSGYQCDTGETARTSSIRVLGPAGERANARALGARTFGVLPDGRFILPSPTAGTLGHLISRTGHVLQRFGTPLGLDPDPSKDRFLSDGLVAVSAGGTFYYATRFAPAPLLLKFSADGRELARTQIQGDAVSAIAEIADRVPALVADDRFTGIVIVNAVDVDSQSGHVFLGLNGTSETSVLYEYTSDLRKLREFRPELPDRASTATNVQDLHVDGAALTAVIDRRLFRYSMSPPAAAFARASDKEARFLRRVRRQTSCPAQVPMQSCAQTCGVGGGSIDCKAELQVRLQDNDRTTSWECKLSTPFVCDASVNYCNTATFVRGTLSAHQECGGRKDADNDGYTLDMGDCQDQLACANPGAWSSQNYCDINACDHWDDDCNGVEDAYQCNGSPILVDLDGSGVKLTDELDGVRFDLNADGTLDRVSWTETGAEVGFLALDRNANLSIDNGAELFGNFTPQNTSSRPNGFSALALYDTLPYGGNRNGLIDSGDSIYSQLLLWVDGNHDASSQRQEMKELREAGIAAIDLDFRESRRTDRFGNVLGLRSKVHSTKPHIARWAYDVFLVFSRGQ